VNDPILTLLAAIIAALMGLGALGAVRRKPAPQVIGYGAAGLAGLAALLALVSLLLDNQPTKLALPLGLPGAAFGLGLDPLAAFFAFLVFGAGAVTGAFAAASDDPAGGVTRVPVCLAGLGLTVLAADGLARGTGLAIAGTAIWAMDPTHRSNAVLLGVSLLAAAAVIVGAAAPPPVPLLAALLGPGALAGFFPLHAWFPQAHRSTTPAAALLSGAVVPVALYAMLRLLFGSAAAPATWWGLPLLLLGAATAVAGGLDATRQPEIDTAFAAGTVRQTGLAAIGLGIALTARAADLPAVTAMALGAVLVLAALQAICGTLLPLIAGAIHLGAGTRRLDRLGGLVHRMPVTSVCLLAGLFGVAALPPGAGFAAIWLLFESLLALPRAGGLALKLLLCLLAVVLGLAAALASACLLRVAGVVCLGRPRTPRAAAADERPRPAQRPLLSLAVPAALLGIFIGPMLHVLADPPIQVLTGTGLGSRATMLGLAPGAESPGYDTLPLACLLLLAIGLVLWLRRLRGVPSGVAGGPAWDDGFAAPPAWLPFGNPATQSAGTSFAPVVFPPVPAKEGTYAARFAVCAAMTRMAGGTGLRASAAVLILAAALLAFCAWTGAT
jgi:hydrogenase-4 component B